MLTKIKNNYSKIILVAGVVLSLVIRYLCLNFESFDYIGFISKWVRYYAENGGWSALKNQMGDYNVMYQYIMVICSFFDISSLYTSKFVSIIFDFVLALGCCRCLSCFNVGKKGQHLMFVAVLLLPTVWLNSALWGQCDSIYVSFIVWSLYFLIKEKYCLSVISLTLAFTFKLQTIFFMPVFCVLLFKKQIKIRHLIAFPVTYFVTCIPALAFGKPFADIISIYVRQTSEYPWLSMNAPTFWQMIDRVLPSDFLSKAGIFMAGAGVVAVFIWAMMKKGKADGRTILTLTMIFAVGIPFFLPHMHDRYFFMADIISIIYVVVFGFRRIHIPLFIQYASLVSYLNYIGAVNLYGGAILPVIMTGPISGVVMLAALVQIGVYGIRDYDKKEFTSRINYIALGAVVLVFVCFNLISQSPIGVKVNGKTVCYVGLEPYKHEDTYMLPIKAYLNSCGYFIAVSGETGNVVASKDGQSIEFDFASEQATVNGETVVFKYPHANVNSNNFMSSHDLCAITGMKEKYENSTLYFYNK